MDDARLAAFVARAQRGDREAIAVLYDVFAPRVHRFLLLRVGNPDDAEDLLQRTFLKMIEALPRYRDRGLPFAAWIFRITRNAIIDQARTRRPQEPLDAAAARPAVIGDPLRAAEMASERQRLTAALEQLTPAQREVVTLRFFAGLSPAEVAAVIGKREEAVRGLQFRGLAALRQVLGEASPAASHDLLRRPRLGAAER